jgi:hypothetical protein
MAKDAKRVYPHAVSLMETVRTYGQTLDLVEKNKGIEWLVAEYRNEAQRMISKGAYSYLVFRPRWEKRADDDFASCRYEHPMGLLYQPVRYCAVYVKLGWAR